MHWNITLKELDESSRSWFGLNLPKKVGENRLIHNVE
jgi:hypothetical protein